MNRFGLFLEHAALICLCLVIAGAMFFFLVEWLATSPSQVAEARVIEVPVREDLERNNRAA